MTGTARSAVSACVQLAINCKNIQIGARAIKNLAGFDHGFRFIGQKHICAALKQTAAQTKH